MSQQNWKQLFSHKGDELLTGLHNRTVKLCHMIFGIGGFIIKRIPELCRRWFGEFLDLAIYLGRLAFQLGKLAGIAGTWAIIVFAPPIFHFGWISLAWLAVAFYGSFWGLRHYGGKRQLSVAKKEVANATA
jgi:hypothetical protein